MVPAIPISIPYQLRDCDRFRLTDQHSLSYQGLSSPLLSTGKPGNLWAADCEQLLRDSRDSANPRYGIAPCRSTDQPGLSFCAESGFDKLARLSVHETCLTDQRCFCEPLFPFARAFQNAQWGSLFPFLPWSASFLPPAFLLPRWLLGFALPSMGAKSLRRLLRLLRRLLRRLSFCSLLLLALPWRFALLPFAMPRKSGAFPDPLPLLPSFLPSFLPCFPLLLPLLLPWLPCWLSAKSKPASKAAITSSRALQGLMKNRPGVLTAQSATARGSFAFRLSLEG